MRFGLRIAVKTGDETLQEELRGYLAQNVLPTYTFVAADTPLFTGGEQGDAFLAKAAAALLMPGEPIPGEPLARTLREGPRGGNVLRRYLFLQLSLLPYLRPGREVVQTAGGHWLGGAVLVAHLSAEGAMDLPLPEGVWTDLTDGSVHTGRLRGLRSLNAMPVLVRPNTLLPVGVNDRAIDADDADRLTLHWFEPAGEAACMLADGTAYMAREVGGSFNVKTVSDKPWHLIVHRDGEERLVYYA